MIRSQQLLFFKGTKSPVFKMVNCQTCVAGTLALDIRKMTATRTIGTGANKFSKYCKIYLRYNIDLQKINVRKDKSGVYFK